MMLRCVSSALVLVVLMGVLSPPPGGDCASMAAGAGRKHHNYEELLETLTNVNRRCPSITYLYNLTGHPDQTTQGRHLAVIVLSDNPERHETGELLAMHDH